MGFEGFTKETVRFLGGLRAHNDRDWFEAHRKDYEGAYLGPAMAFAEALAPRLRKIEPDVSVEPRVNGSIMRINRDIRFSKDKSPYKDHLDMWFWAGDRKGWDTSGFWFRLTPDRLMLGAGMHGFEPTALARYRAAVLNDKKGRRRRQATKGRLRGRWRVVQAAARRRGRRPSARGAAQARRPLRRLGRETPPRARQTGVRRLRRQALRRAGPDPSLAARDVTVSPASRTRGRRSRSRRRSTRRRCCSGPGS